MSIRAVVQDVASEVARATPPGVVVVSHHFMGMPLSDWASILTIAYTAVAFVFMLKKHFTKGE